MGIVHSLLQSFIKSHAHHECISLAQKAIALGNEYIAISAGVLLVFAAILGIANIFLSILNHVTGSRYRSLFPTMVDKGHATLAHTRIEMGSLFALGLELLVVTDVLETLTKDLHEFTYDLLGKIGTVALCRLVLAYFLGREMNELRKEGIEEAKQGKEREEKEREKERESKKERSERRSKHE